MMDAQRRLRAAKAGGDMAGMAVTVNEGIESFIQKITMKAMSGLLEEGEERFLKERVEADICALEWVKLAQKAGALSLTEDIVALGGELQLTRLKEVRGCRGEDLAKALTCMVLSGPCLTGFCQTINDWYDRDLDAINEPYRPIPSGPASCGRDDFRELLTGKTMRNRHRHAW